MSGRNPPVVASVGTQLNIKSESDSEDESLYAGCTVQDLQSVVRSQV